MSWYINDIARFKSEREGIETLALTTDWLLLGNMGFDERFSLRVESLPQTLVDEASERTVSIFKITADAALPPLDDLQGFKAACSAMGFEIGEATFAIIVRGFEIYFYYLNAKDNTVGDRAIIPPQPIQRRLDEAHEALKEKSVALIGCGSLGSKIGSMLARSGVSRFALVDDDILLPDNLVRHDLDWRDVGSHKADALARRLNLVSPTTQADARRVRLQRARQAFSIIESEQHLRNDNNTFA